MYLYIVFAMELHGRVKSIEKDPKTTNINFFKKFSASFFASRVSVTHFSKYGLYLSIKLLI